MVLAINSSVSAVAQASLYTKNRENLPVATATNFLTPTASSDDTAVQDFLDFMKETLGQRMFDE
jgi:hypothetical protein